MTAYEAAFGALRDSGCVADDDLDHLALAVAVCAVLAHEGFLGDGRPEARFRLTNEFVGDHPLAKKRDEA